MQDKYQDVLRLEASVAQLHEMFVDFAQLTEQQGELLDQIEFQVISVLTTSLCHGLFFAHPVVTSFFECTCTTL